MKIFYTLFLILVFSMTTEAKDQSHKTLPPCRDTPNCVSSQAPLADQRHYIAPFTISGDPKRAWEAFRTTLKTHDRVVITHENEVSLHAEATSLVFRFVDDIDAYLDVEAGLIHVRSASRVGHSDFGVNRRRIESIRTTLRKLHVLA